ncbi:MAG: FKBP-type peptidyl-prolyl cis-trans isomerase [Bacteroidales bacterium]|nr:FKBP-type peptidyl-prolyl cis-trans isomerase [Bacteroidales bacterium]
MKKYLFIAITMVTAGLFLASCNQSGKSYPGFTKTADGLFYKFYNQSGDTTQPKMGEFCEVELVYGTPDSVLFNSKNLPESRKPMIIPMIKSLYKGDIYEGLSLMHVGDSAKFMTSADSVFKKLFRVRKMPAFIDSTGDMYFSVKLLAVKTQQQLQAEQMAKMKKMEEAETADRDAYLKKNKITTKPTKSGLYVIHKKYGRGPHPTVGDVVKVNYTGYLLNGTKFDSSYDRKKPFEFTLGKHQVIAGWDEGIAMLRKGGKATLIIPSTLGYGPRTVGPIPPYSTLVFEVELVDFHKAPAKKTKK